MSIAADLLTTVSPQRTDWEFPYLYFNPAPPDAPRCQDPLADLVGVLDGNIAAVRRFEGTPRELRTQALRLLIQIRDHVDGLRSRP